MFFFVFFGLSHFRAKVIFSVVTQKKYWSWRPQTKTIGFLLTSCTKMITKFFSSDASFSRYLRFCVLGLFLDQIDIFDQNSKTIGRSDLTKTVWFLLMSCRKLMGKLFFVRCTVFEIFTILYFWTSSFSNQVPGRRLLSNFRPSLCSVTKFCV